MKNPPDDASPQRDAFLGGEGDRWFSRNDSDSIARHTQHALDLILPSIDAHAAVLEIGCADGRNLAHIAALRPAAQCHGIDPSAAAVAAGQAKFPSLRLSAGSCDRLPFADASFDVVIFGFCLYLVDRGLLLASVAEADRVLRDRGYLAIVDFDPAAPRKRRYRHLDGLYSYKMDYSRIFLASSHYHMVSKHSYSHGGPGFHSDPGERVATTVLFKDIASAYLPEED